MTKIYALTVGILAFSMVSCDYDSGNPPTDLVAFWKFEGYQYQNNLSKIPDSINIDVYFGTIYSPGNDFEGESGLRNYWGRFRLNDHEISLSDFKVTYIPSYSDSVAYYNIENKYLHALMKAKRYTVEADVLTIFLSNDSSLVYKKNPSTVYSDNYVLSAIVDGEAWTDSSFYIGQGLYTFYLEKSSISKSKSDTSYSLHTSFSTRSKTGISYQNNQVEFTSAIKTNTHTYKNSSGYIKLTRMSRAFVAAEFEFHMVPADVFSSKEFDITSGKFKAKISLDDYPLYLNYN